MANPIIDPAKAKYFPEMLIECINEASISTSGEHIASYLLNDRRCVVENPEVFTQTANLDLVVSADSSERARIRSNAQTLRDPGRYVKVTARETLDFTGIMTAGGPTTNVRSRWNMTFRRPLVVDKLREKSSLDTDEINSMSEIIKQLEDNMSLGTIPFNQSLLNIDPAKLFDDVICVEKNMAAMAAGAESIIGGSKINIPNPNSQLIVLLGVMFDTSCFAAGTASDTFVVVDRDIDANYMKLDVTGMADQFYMKCFVPCIKSLEVCVESATGTGGNTVPCGFIYGTRKLNVADHIRWNLPFNSATARSDAQKLATDWPKTVKSIRAGVV
jgi:hypothetical protein